MPILTYTLARVGLFALALAALFLAGLRGWLLILAALAIAALVSYIALPKLRNSAAGTVERLATRSQRKKRTEEDREDELIESRIAEHRDEVEADGALPDRASDPEPHGDQE